jgi:cell division septum initiation protein DivIVA
MPEFEITMGGYDIKEVDRLVSMVEEARDAEASDTRSSALQALRLREIERFPRKFRGYSKIQVRNYVEDRLREISEGA